MVVPDLVKTVASKHNFDLSHLGRSLLVSAVAGSKRGSGGLMINVWDGPEHFSVWCSGVNGVGGYCMWYSPDWEPIRCVDDFGCELVNLSQAETEIGEVITARYLESEWSSVVSLKG